MLTQFHSEPLADMAVQALDLAKKQGADQAEVSINDSDGITINARSGDIDTIERGRVQAMHITLYKKGAKGSADTTDLSLNAIDRAVTAASAMANFSQPDPCAGLANKNLLAWQSPDLELCHPWDIDINTAIDLAIRCETAARDYDRRICNTEGASISSYQSQYLYANSHGFNQQYQTTRHSLNCTALASQDNEMQRDYWYDVSRIPSELDSAENIGHSAAKRALARLQPEKISTRKTPVLFPPETARSLWGHFIHAIQGHALYRQASFLVGAKGQALFPKSITLKEQPHLKSALGSAPFDREGVTTRDRDIVQHGTLLDYVLDSYAARKLGMATTGNAGGVHNLSLIPGDRSFEELIGLMHRGLVVTELMGSGVNTVTGDYSRGATGFWVENGEIQYPVAEITIAGNLKHMFEQIGAIGNDIHNHATIRTGSLIIDNMTIAGT